MNLDHIEVIVKHNCKSNTIEIMKKKKQLKYLIDNGITARGAMERHAIESAKLWVNNECTNFSGSLWDHLNDNTKCFANF